MSHILITFNSHYALHARSYSTHCVQASLIQFHTIVSLLFMYLAKCTFIICTLHISCLLQHFHILIHLPYYVSMHYINHYIPIYHFYTFILHISRERLSCIYIHHTYTYSFSFTITCNISSYSI